MKGPIAFLPLTVLLVACVPGGIAPQQTEIPAASVGLGEAPAPVIPQKWWTGFGDPVLDRLMDEALAGNPGLGESIARLRAAKAGVEAANANIFPRVDFNANEQHTRFSETYIIPPPFGGSTNWIGTIEGDLSWEIDFWGKQAAALAKARSLRNAAQMDVEAARLALSGAVVQAYVQLDSTYKLADIAAQTERERRDTLTLTKQRVRDGLDSQVEEQEAEALFAQASESRVRADSERDIAAHELAALAGRGADVYAAIDRPRLNLDASLPLPPSLPADLLARRPDMIAAQLRVDAAFEGRKVAAAEFYPNVDLLASAGWAAVGLSPLFTSRSAQYGEGPAVHLPLFDAGTLRAQYAGATAEIDEAVADYNGSLANAVHETADALTRIRSLQGQIVMHRQNLDAAEKGYSLAVTRYRTGLTNQLTVLNAENVLYDARTGDVSLRAEQAVQRVTLLLAVGGGFEAQGPAATRTSSR